MPVLLAIDKIPVGDALVLSLVGMTIVFVVLLALMLVTKLLASAFSEKKTGEIPSPVEAVVVRAEAARTAQSGMVPAAGSSGDVELNSVDDRTAALLMAIVADDMKAPLNELRFVSIKELH